jgi:uncharacterized protein YbaR (Trm112 family)
MHILLTDVLSCPRCGPEFGLILLADRIEDRRVLAGRLGCPNCREQYPISDGVVDLSAGASGGAQAPAAAGHAEGAAGIDSAVRIAALLGIERGPANVLLAGEAGRHAEALASLLTDVEVITLAPEAPARAGAAGAGSVSHVVTAAMPLASGKMGGVALYGPLGDEMLEEAARLVRPTGRLLVDPAPADAAARLARLGLRPLAREGDVLVAVRG